MDQLTLKAPFSIEGKTLHAGVVVKATFNPAPVGNGIKFKRVDIEGAPEIPALAEKVVDTTRGTVIGAGDVRVSTIEHAMAALYASGIDNCTVELNGPEMPILDGSAAPYIECIENVGVEEQGVEKDYYIIKSKTKLKD